MAPVLPDRLVAGEVLVSCGDLLELL